MELLCDRWRNPSVTLRVTAPPPPAPIQQGDVVGTVELKLAGETIGVVNLIAGQDVHQNALLFTVSKVQAFFHSLYLKVVIVLSLLTLAVYGLWVFINLWNGRRPNRKIHRR